MKITRSQLRRIIKEEISTLNEQAIETYKITFTDADGKKGETGCKDKSVEGMSGAKHWRVGFEEIHGPSKDYDGGHDEDVVPGGKFGKNLKGGPFKAPVKDVKLVKCSPGNS